MRSHRDQVHVRKVHHQEAAEREQHAPEQRGGGRQAQAPEQPVHAGKGEGIRGGKLEIERDVQRQRPVQEQVPGMEHAGLPFAVQVVAGKQARRPQQGVTSPSACWYTWRNGT